MDAANQELHLCHLMHRLVRVNRVELLLIIRRTESGWSVRP